MPPVGNLSSDTLLDTERRPEVVAGIAVESHDAGVSKPLLDGGKLG